MSHVPVRRPATYADLLAVPEHLVAELIDGELYTFARPAPEHLRTASRLGGILMSPFDEGRGGPGGWLLVDEPELHLNSQVVVPDLAGWRLERMPATPSEAFFTLAPDWICEVLSPSTESFDRVKKLRIYAVARVQYAWLLNPRERTLEVFRLLDGRWSLMSAHADAEVVRAEPFEAIEIELSRL